MLPLDKKNNIRAFDLFSGVGGFRKAALSSSIKKFADVSFVGYCEIDEYATRTYNANFDTKGEYYLKDVNALVRTKGDNELTYDDNIDVERCKKINDEMPDFDLLLAGFPCQPYSLMGNRKGMSDSRGSLFFCIREILRAKHPKYFILENVRAIKSVNDGQVFNYICDLLTNELGYNIRVLDLNTADFGLPQTRRRTYFIGTDNGRKTIGEPPKVDLWNQKRPTTWHFLEKEVDEKYYLSEKIKATILKDEDKGYKRKAEINKLIARPLTMTMHKMHRASQDNYFSNSFINGKYDEAKKAVHLCDTGDELIRRITPLEAFRLQGFDDQFVTNAINEGLSDTRLYMQAGNTVSVPVIASIIETLIRKE